MIPVAEEQRTGLIVGWIALGATLVALAFTIRPVRASTMVFWFVILSGAAIAGFGAISHFRHRSSRSQLVASECRRLYEALKALLEEQEHARPRSTRFNKGGRRDAWVAETVERYEDELQRWARKVFSQAVKVDALSEASRSLLDAKSTSQLINLRDLFRGAAEDLEERG